jgi:hypothetical protein
MRPPGISTQQPSVESSERSETVAERRIAPRITRLKSHWAPSERLTPSAPSDGKKRRRAKKVAERVGEAPLAVVSIPAMLASHRFYFWYYRFPMPLAEEGSRSS